jgi:hypothetical protein
LEVFAAMLEDFITGLGEVGDVGAGGLAAIESNVRR